MEAVRRNGGWRNDGSERGNGKTGSLNGNTYLCSEKSQPREAIQETKNEITERRNESTVKRNDGRREGNGITD